MTDHISLSQLARESSLCEIDMHLSNSIKLTDYYF